MIRQGDILLKKISKIPKGLKKREDKTIALGKVTGHHHSFNGLVNIYGERGVEQYADVKQESVLEHQEHKHILIPKGKYKVIQQREFDLVEGVRSVTD